MSEMKQSEQKEQKQDSTINFYKVPFNHLSSDQSSLVSSFRASFIEADNQLMSDYDCVRFLSAREWKLVDAVAMKKHNFKLRRNLQSELILQKPKDPVIDALFKLRRSGVSHNCFGRDKQVW